MSEPTVVCPKCGSEIKLTESLAAPMVASMKKDYEKLLASKDAHMAERERQMNESKAKFLQEKEAFEETVNEKLRVERVRIAAEASKKAKAEVEATLSERETYIVELNGKLAEAQKAQAELVRKERELADEKREMDLTIERQVSTGLESARAKAREEAEGSLRMKVTEKEEVIASLSRQIEDLKRRAEQGSQQLQGEVQELILEAQLKESFPGDVISPVPKGEFGGDALQQVMTPSGQLAGTILWESKRTKAWSAGWLSKLRDDQRAAKAEVSILVSQTLPSGLEQFSADYIEGVWVIPFKLVKPMAIAVRQQLLEVARARTASEGQETKMGMVYGYLTGPRFRQRVQAIVEAFSSMKEDLDRERKAITKQWAKREEQISRVMQSTVGMYGDLQGIAGKSVQEIEGLDLPGLPAHKEE